MLTGLRLKNFKAWQDTGDVILKPVTILLGVNSSGKSSLIQSLLLLKQTVQSPDRMIHLNLGGDESNDLFDFGDFDTVLRQGAETPRQFSVSFDFKANSQSRVPSGHFHGVYAQPAAGGVCVQSLALKTGNRSFSAVRRDKGAYSIYLDKEKKPRCKGKDYAPERSVALPAAAIAMLDKDGALLEDLSLEIRRQLEGISYLGPLRRKPQRNYSWNKSVPGELGSDGHHAIDMLFASALVKGGRRYDLINEISDWLARMDVAQKLEIRQLGRSNRYEVMVHRDGVAANLLDVGVGIAQVLPVLTLAYSAPEGSTIVLEEPEIHLHPLAQSVLAELFVEVSEKRRVQFVVETHSEHLFRRLQTLVARRSVNADNVAMYFVEKNDGVAELRNLMLDEYGRVKNWPHGFFGDALGETRELARLMFQRQKENQT